MTGGHDYRGLPGGDTSARRRRLGIHDVQADRREGDRTDTNSRIVESGSLEEVKNSWRGPGYYYWPVELVLQDVHGFKILRMPARVFWRTTIDRSIDRKKGLAKRLSRLFEG